MTADDRKTLEELREHLRDMHKAGCEVYANDIAALTRVLEEPGDAELIAWGLALSKTHGWTGSIMWNEQMPLTGEIRNEWLLVAPRGEYINLGTGPLPVLTPAARAVLLEAYRKEHAHAK